MNHYPRRENPLESLLRWRRNVFLQVPGGGYVLVSATRYMVALHHFDGSLRGDPARTEHLEQFPASLFDGQGWNAQLLHNLIQPEQIMTEQQQPFTALYCKPFRESIRQMTDFELRVFLALATRSDEQGVSFPGVRVLADDTGLRPEQVSDGLQGLQRKGLMVYLRHNAIDPITKKIMPNVYGLSPEILRINSDSGIQTYMHEFLSQISPSDPAQPESPISNTNKNHQISSTSNHHHQPPPKPADALEGVGALRPGKDYANRGELDIRIEPDKPAVQPQPTSAPAQPEKTPPSSAPPPADLGELKPYAAPLPQIDLEAYANELQYRCEGLQLAKARQLVTAYGVEQCSLAVGLLANQPFGSVKNKAGWLINKLRQGALVPEDGIDAAVRGFQHDARQFGNYSS